MLIELSKEDFLKAHKLLICNGIKHSAYGNHNWAICNEQIVQAINSSNILEDKNFYDIVGDEAGDIVFDLTWELNDREEAKKSFQELKDIAKLIVDKKLEELEKEQNI